MKTHRAGYSNDGVPSNIDIVRSLQGSVARRIAMTAGKKRKIHELEEKLASLYQDKKENNAEIKLLDKELDSLKKKVATVPFIDTFDLRFRNYENARSQAPKQLCFA